MSVIGTFTPAKDGRWTGMIHTLTIYAKVRLVPNDTRENENAPAFRVFKGEARIGEAWEAKPRDGGGKGYFRVQIDDPTLATPISAVLFPSEDGGEAQLVWSRRREP